MSFLQTCLHSMSYKFLKETVIRDPLIQSNIAAVSMVTEALQCQETSKEILKQETIPKKGKVWYYNQCQCAQLSL